MFFNFGFRVASWLLCLQGSPPLPFCAGPRNISRLTVSPPPAVHFAAHFAGFFFQNFGPRITLNSLFFFRLLALRSLPSLGPICSRDPFFRQWDVSPRPAWGIAENPSFFVPFSLSVSATCMGGRLGPSFVLAAFEFSFPVAARPPGNISSSYISAFEP